MEHWYMYIKKSRREISVLNPFSVTKLTDNQIQQGYENNVHVWHDHMVSPVDFDVMRTYLPYTLDSCSYTCPSYCIVCVCMREIQW